MDKIQNIPEGYRDDGIEFPLEDLIACIGREKFDADFQKAWRLLAEVVSEWESFTPRELTEADFDIGHVKFHSTVGEPFGPKYVVVSIWPSQEICNEIGHLEEYRIEYEWALSLSETRIEDAGCIG